MVASGDDLRLILGLKLRNLRLARGEGLRQVASRAGLSVSYLSELEQGGWTIEYSDYALTQGIWLPGKVILSRPQARLTLLQKKWQLL